MSEDELPSFIERDVLRDVATVDVPDEAILRCFVSVDKPFLSKSSVAEMTGFSNEAARKRLNSLVNRGVLWSAEAGKQTKIYWLNHPDSQWPVPRDLTGMESEKKIDGIVTRVNRVATGAVFYGSMFAVLFLLDVASSLEVTDGVVAISLDPAVIHALAFVLLAIVFYIAFLTSIHVQNNDVGWPTIRRVYRRVAH